jgi:hypothetical protein
LSFALPGSTLLPKNNQKPAEEYPHPAGKPLMLDSKIISGTHPCAESSPLNPRYYQ